jgi:hypothetical protein
VLDKQKERINRYLRQQKKQIDPLSEICIAHIQKSAC